MKKREGKCKVERDGSIIHYRPEGQKGWQATRIENCRLISLVGDMRGDVLFLQKKRKQKRKPMERCELHAKVEIMDCRVVGYAHWDFEFGCLAFHHDEFGGEDFSIRYSNNPKWDAAYKQAQEEFNAEFERKKEIDKRFWARVDVLAKGERRWLETYERN